MEYGETTTYHCLCAGSFFSLSFTYTVSSYSCVICDTSLLHTHTHTHTNILYMHIHVRIHTHTHRQAQSDMTILIQVLCATFADHCPVYSKTAQQPQPQPQMSWQHHPQRPVQPPSTYSTPTAYRSPYPQQQPPRLQYPTGMIVLFPVNH